LEKVRFFSNLGFDYGQYIQLICRSQQRNGCFSGRKQTKISTSK